MCRRDYDFDTLEEKYEYLWSNYDDLYLNTLRDEYKLFELTKDCKADIDKAKVIMNWVHNLWAHDGLNEPSNDDPISILREVREGKRFRCVEYGIVISGCLNALGIPSRKLSLRTEDMETREFGAGHVVLEAYIKELNKWIFIDGQFNIIPMLDDVPLNAIEFQQAFISKTPELKIFTYSDIAKEQYFNWINGYLYYFTTKFDNRVEVSKSKMLMLVPNGAKFPRVFQRKYPLDDYVYTNSVQAFYPCPIKNNIK
jgi:hypothetical protein